MTTATEEEILCHDERPVDERARWYGWLLHCLATPEDSPAAYWLDNHGMGHASPDDRRPLPALLRNGRPGAPTQARASRSGGAARVGDDVVSRRVPAAPDSETRHHHYRIVIQQ
jgi:hypothetical protein